MADSVTTRMMKRAAREQILQRWDIKIPARRADKLPLSQLQDIIKVLSRQPSPGEVDLSRFLITGSHTNLVCNMSDGGCEWRCPVGMAESFDQVMKQIKAHVALEHNGE